MPTTVTGLVLFVALLLPGISYVAIRERGTARQARSAFRETATVATVSVLSLVAVWVAFLIVRFCWPRSTRVVEELIRVGWEGVRDEYVKLGSWLIGALVFAVLLACAAAWLAGLMPHHPSAMSAWWMLFERWNRKHHKHVRCVLEDGAWIEGYVASFNHAGDDTADRELILIDPIRYMREWDPEPFDPQVGAVCLSARRIVAMFVTDIAPEKNVTATSEAVASAGTAEAVPSETEP